MIRIIPAIDIIEGKCVRLTKGDFETKKIYNSDPLEVAKQFEDAGIKYLHMIDLDGARQRKIINHPVLQKVAKNTNLKIDFGGGVQSDHDLKIAFECGAQQITAGSVTVKNEKLALSWLKKYGPEKIILGADFKDNKVAVSGWQETKSIEILNFLKNQYINGFRNTVCTDISRDGVLQGPAFDFYQIVKKEIPGLNIIASGGVSKIEDVVELNKNGMDGVIIGKAIYEEKIQLKQLEPFLE
ncbi:MAG: 1-(5-phosphoribosyl)-5-[(5-phosphoribosylamino)methylideneamino]imidazole-4-carboxamide isomerase [Calditrichaeota bacterium]|nr:MAG: 1-(5-phosphoribosyl)-5-[(5-phosphoribosylamino)methylideneamino]imidazole-4-carboxamide isomerase [Calditrichota bacterium]MBL1205616.1 1-(5-phosphoribosyl)-5-[(5-phosphoribosylamino)methylideneamino]imidazole-4-carboxamide isomerase [Calditrichota bacterium]NOG45444.1 1-(5-phosphoribosyl)-5-[(5-phosphoribosylamino)methylideneamino]imidazole-4-carboxamide isomerase [Calditrichota bacterium]